MHKIIIKTFENLYIKLKKHLLLKSLIILLLYKQMNSIEQCCYFKTTKKTYSIFQYYYSKTITD